VAGFGTADERLNRPAPHPAFGCVDPLAPLAGGIDLEAMLLRCVVALLTGVAKDVLKRDATAYRRLRDELKWLAGLFGAARDLDVLWANLPSPAPGDRASTRALAGVCEAKRLRAHQVVADGLDGERARTLQLDLAMWIEDGSWHRQSSGIAEEPIPMYAGARLKRRFRKTGETRRGPRKACFWRPPPNSHRGKKLRYLAESSSIFQASPSIVSA
jgi:CHAD domain-containing protein